MAGSGANVPSQAPKCCCEGDKKNTTKSLVLEVSAEKANEGAGNNSSGSCTNGGCKCGPNCNCNPCNCDK